MAEVVVRLESVLALQEQSSSRLHPGGMTILGRKVPMFLFPSGRESSVGGTSIKSLGLCLDTVENESRIVCRFNFETISLATENFSAANKIWQHPFGSMYKGTLINGQGIAVMRPDSDLRSQEYYINEVLLLVKLEHENLAQLLGYCNEGTTTFVVYEFAPYASLNHSKVDMLTRLDLDLRYKIILAIARVLLYLHKNAPIRIIHGDVNPGNIYLDENMNPKLLGFGFARCLAINEADGVDANVVCGTCSCMAPEYAFGGRLSTKVDVFSFGALVLQTITGCRRYPEANENFMEYAWTDWCKATYFDIIDPKIDVDSCLVKTFIDIGLLCVQADAEQRPTMEEVVGMLLRATFDTPPIPRNTMSPQIIEADSHCTNAPNILPSNDYDSGAVEEFISELQPR